MAQITGNLLQRYGDIRSISGILKQRYSDIFIQGILLQRYADQQFVTGKLKQRYRDLSSAFVAAIGTQNPQPTTGFGINPPSGSQAGGNVFPPGVDFTFGMKAVVNQASTGTNLTLNDAASGLVETFAYTCRKNQGVNFTMRVRFGLDTLSQSKISTIDQFTDPASFAGDQNIDITILVSLQVADTTVQLPPLVILDKQYEEDENGWGFTLSGVDWLTRMLNKRNLNLNSYVSGVNGPGFAASIWFATQILSNFLPQFGITNFNFNFDDYPIRALHIQNTRPVDILNQVLWVPRAYWWPAGKTLNTQPWTIVSTPNWVYQDQPNAIIKFVESSQAIDLINRVKVNLSVPASVKGAILEITSWGRFQVTFQTPLRRPYTQVEIAQNGQILTTDYFDTNGNWIAHFPMETNVAIPPTVGNGGFPGSTNMIGSAAVVWAPPLQVGATGSGLLSYLSQPTTTHLKMAFRGADPFGPAIDQFLPPSSGPYVMPASVTAFSAVYQNGVPVTQQPTATTGINSDQQYSVIVQDSNSIAKYGLLEAEHPVENALIPNLAWAWRVGVNTLQESGRLNKTYNIQVPLNPVMNVGDTVQLIDSAKFINIMGLVEEVQHNTTQNDGLTTFKMVVYHT